MLTIKFVNHDGRETISIAESVDYFPEKQSPNDFSGVTTWFKGQATGYECGLTSDSARKVYVMNENGKTVATYNL